MNREHPNYGDDLPATCERCGHDEYTWVDGVCPCGHVVDTDAEHEALVEDVKQLTRQRDTAMSQLEDALSVVRITLSDLHDLRIEFEEMVVNDQG